MLITLVVVRLTLQRTPWKRLRHDFALLIILLIVFLLWTLLPAVLPQFQSYALKIVVQPLDSSVFSMMGTILATILGIFFSISIIVVQHAASNYTPSILEGYKKDRKTWFVLSYYLISLIMSIIALQYPQDVFLSNVMVILFIFSFLLLAVQFVHIIDLIDPREIIRKTQNTTLNDIEKIPKKLKSILKRKAKNQIEGKYMKLPLFEYSILHSEKSLMSPPKTGVLQISDIIMRASKRGELETCTVGLNALSQIAAKYVSIRKEDPITEDDFIQYLSTQLISIFRVALENKDTLLLQETILAFEILGKATTDIKSMSVFGGPSLQTGLTLLHIGSLGIKAMENDFADTAADSIKSLTNIGLLAIQKTGGDGLASSKITEIGFSAITRENWFVVNHTFNGLKKLLLYAVINRVDVNSEPYSICEEIEKLVSASIKRGLGLYAFTSLFPAITEDSIEKVVEAAIKIKNEEYAETETHYREEYSKEVISRVNETVGNINNLFSEKGELMLVHMATESMLRIASILMNEKLKTEKDDYNDEIEQIIRALNRSYIFTLSYLLNSNVHASAHENVADAVASIGVKALENEKESIAECCLEALHNMCTSLIKEDKYGYDVARCAERIVIIGMYALHKKRQKIVDIAVAMLCDFEKKYLSESPSPKEGIYIEELRKRYEVMNSERYSLLGENKTYVQIFKEIPETTLNDFELLFETARKKKQK